MAPIPIVDLLVKDHRLTVVTIVWEDGRRRTIATANAADLVQVGVMAKGNQTPEQFEVAFKGKLVEEPRSQQDVLRVVLQRSEN